jgi:predicted nucleotidyltransferase
MRYGLNEEAIQQIQKVFSAFPAIEEAVLYGSRAIGNYKNGSDIDITLKGKSLNGTIVNKVVLALDDLFLPYTFDISMFSQLDNKDIINHINQVGQVFFEKI